MAARPDLVERERDPSRPWAPSPFGRLSRAHALSVGGDAIFTTAMAGLVFFSVTKLDQARWQVAAALVFTIVPFSIAAPFIGPLIDRGRGWRQWMVVGLCLLRAAGCAALVWARDNPVLMYPLFTVVLVLAQGYVLARSSLVPATVRGTRELVRANARLAAISAVGAGAGAATALIVLWSASLLDVAVGPGIVLALAAAAYLGAAVEAGRISIVRLAVPPRAEAAGAVPHSPAIVSASVALSVVRVVVGFTTFLLAFHFKNLEATDAWASRIGLVGGVVAAQVGYLAGSSAATRARRRIVEEQIITVALAGITVAGLVAAGSGGIGGALLLAFGLGIGSSTAKQSFDAIVQRDAPDEMRGRAFASFETRLQLWWVAGALVPVIVDVPPSAGFAAAGGAGVAVTLWYVLARRRLRRAPIADVALPVLAPALAPDLPLVPAAVDPVGGTTGAADETTRIDVYDVTTPFPAPLTARSDGSADPSPAPWRGRIEPDRPR